MERKREKVVYKVVDKNSRTSIVVGRYDTGTAQEIKDEFALRYEPGIVVRAKRESFGIFCFKSLEAAESWSQYNFANRLIIKVRPIGTKKPTPSFIPSLRYCSLPELLLKIKRMRSGVHMGAVSNWPVVSGTVCYTAVEVLE